MNQISNFSAKLVWIAVLNSYLFARSNFINSLSWLQCCQIYIRKTFIIWKIGFLQTFEQQIDCIVFKWS